MNTQFVQQAWQPNKQHAWQLARRAFIYIFTWQWCTGLLAWTLQSAGTISGLAFMVAPLWILTNASVHPFPLLFMSEQMTKNISYFADMALVGLPELLTFTLILRVIHLVSLMRYQGTNPLKNLTTLWLVTFGIPILVFFVITLIALAYSLADIGFQLPTWAVVVRGIAAYCYGIATLVYEKKGKTQERDRLEQKDNLIAQLREQSATALAELRQQKDTFIADLRLEKDTIIAQLTSDFTTQRATMIAQFNAQCQALRDEIARQNDEIDRLNTHLAESRTAQTQLIKAVSKSTEDALQGYSDECKTWLKGEHKTVIIDEIVRYTGHSKRKITAAIKSKHLETSTRNKELVLVSSLREWLERTPAPTGETSGETAGETEPHLPVLQLVNS
jgi:hypothetical protein